MAAWPDRRQVTDDSRWISDGERVDGVHRPAVTRTVSHRWWPSWLQLQPPIRGGCRQWRPYYRFVTAANEVFLAELVLYSRRYFKRITPVHSTHNSLCTSSTFPVTLSSATPTLIKYSIRLVHKNKKTSSQSQCLILNPDSHWNERKSRSPSVFFPRRKDCAYAKTCRNNALIAGSCKCVTVLSVTWISSFPSD